LSLSLLALSPISVFAEAVYEITESELTELETKLTEQATTIETLQTTLSRQRTTIERLSGTLERQASTIAQLSTSFDEYADAARASEIRTALIAGAIGIGVGAAGAIAAILIIR